MLSVADAHELIAKHLHASSRARHSVFVGYVMRRLAAEVGADATVWEVVGLVHDLDHEATTEDRTRHGIVTTEWLAHRLPANALGAIAAHDHRTGVVADTPLAFALKLADALAVICDELGAEAPAVLGASDAAALLEARLARRQYLPALLAENAARLGVSLLSLAEIAEDGPSFVQTCRTITH